MQYVATKRDLIATAKQLASMAQDQGVALARLSSTSDDLAATKLELDKVQTQLQDVLLVRSQDPDLDPKQDCSTLRMSPTLRPRRPPPVA